MQLLHSSTYNILFTDQMWTSLYCTTYYTSSIKNYVKKITLSERAINPKFILKHTDV